MKKNQFNSTLLLRISIATIFLSHAIVRIANGTIGMFTEFLGLKGFPMPLQLVWSITIFEMIGSILLVLGYYTKWISSIFIFILLVGIVIIHYANGWFVGEHGTGGIEYSFLLISVLIAIAFPDRIMIKKHL